MGYFRGLKSVYKKSEAAVVVQNLLDHQVRVGLLRLDSAKLANKLVEITWDKMPDIFDGKFGQRPHKITVAACALANGVKLFSEGDLNRKALILSLGNVLSEVETNGRLYPLNSLDEQLLEASASSFSKFIDVDAKSSDEEDTEEMTTLYEYSSWEAWFKTFKLEAGKENSQLEEKSNGKSFIDFMELGPLRRAYEDGVDPKFLAREFAAQFDISTFGR